MKKDKLKEYREALAEFLFDGNTEKGEILIALIQSFELLEIYPPEFKDMVMQLPEETCKWCKEGECFFAAPDSMFLCKGRCDDYEQKE